MPNIVVTEGKQSESWFQRFRKKGTAAPSTSLLKEISQTQDIAYGLSGTSVATMLSASGRQIRERSATYMKLGRMESDPICSTSLGLLVTAATGGHETSGQIVFIEPRSSIKGNKALENIVAELDGQLTGFFNEVVTPSAYVGSWAGDAYARVYSNRNKGVIGLHMDENWLPPMVQPYEQAGRTVGYSVFTGPKNWERLSAFQLARLKMARTQFIPQPSVIEKALRVNVTEDDITKLPLLPSLVGGSLLHAAEKPFDDLSATLAGLVGHRLTDSMSEETIGVNLAGMTLDQQRRFMESVTKLFTQSRDRALKAVKEGMPVLEKIKHFLPVFNEKQLINFGGAGNSRSAPLSIEDAMLHARLLAGAIGVDLSMIGFADQMAGGLGEGGFFRTSAQVAERARWLRVALTGFFNHVIDIHTYSKYGFIFEEKDRPYVVNFYGSISALEAEAQRTRTDAMNAGMMLAQAIDMLKNIGCSKEIAEEYFAKTMRLDADQAKLYAQLMETKRPSEMGGGEGGGF